MYKISVKEENSLGPGTKQLKSPDCVSIQRIYISQTDKEDHCESGV